MTEKWFSRFFVRLFCVCKCVRMYVWNGKRTVPWYGVAFVFRFESKSTHAFLTSPIKNNDMTTSWAIQRKQIIRTRAYLVSIHFFFPKHVHFLWVLIWYCVFFHDSIPVITQRFNGHSVPEIYIQILIHIHFLCYWKEASCDKTKSGSVNYVFR